MATRPHEDTDVPFNFGDHPQSVSGKETPLMPEPANCTVKQPADVKPSHDDIFVGGQLKEEQEPEKIWSSICGDNGDLMKDKVSAGTQIGDQTFSLNGKPGGEHNPEMDGFVEFKDCIGRKYKFPYKNVRKWKHMKSAIDEIFKDIDSDEIQARVASTHFDIVNETDNVIILPKFWENLVTPGCKVRMELYPKKTSTFVPPPMAPLPPRIKPPPPMVPPPAIGAPPPIGLPPPMGPPPPPGFGLAGRPPGSYNIEDPWMKKKGKKHKWPGLHPPPAIAQPSTADLSSIEVLDREIWKADDQDIANKWVKNLSDEVKSSPLLRAPGMFRAPASFRDAFKTKSEVLCALLNLSPYHTATFIVRMLCKAEKNHILAQEQWPDVMIVILQALCEHNLHRRKHGPDEEDSAQKLKVESMLAKVYRRGLLPLPEKENPDDYVFMSRDKNIVKSAAAAMNIWTYRKLQSKLFLNPDAETWAIDSTGSSNACVGYNFLRLDGLDIGSLLAMGKINIAWTDCLEKHLQLDTGTSDNDSLSSYNTEATEDSTATLYIYWFDFTEYAWLGSYFIHLDEGELLDRAKEVSKTWTFLFSPNGFLRTYRARKAYRSLPIPSWVKEYLDPFDEHQNLGSLMNSGKAKHCNDMMRHLEDSTLKFNIFTTNKANAQDFPNFSSRIETLRDYVDERKGKGFWHSLYEKDGPHTYWVVLYGAIIALLGLLFVILILAAEIVQAWASVKTMHAIGTNA